MPVDRPTPDAAAMERLVDAHGLQGIASVLADVCLEKAEHVSTTWGDENLARAWQRAGELLTWLEGIAKMEGI